MVTDKPQPAEQRLEKDFPDWRNAVEMIRSAGYQHPAETIEAMADEIERLRSAIRTALGFHQVTHIHAALREALDD